MTTKYTALHNAVLQGEVQNADKVAFGALVCIHYSQRMHIRFQGDDPETFYGLRIPYSAGSGFPKNNLKYNQTFTVDTYTIDTLNQSNHLRAPKEPFKLVLTGIAKVRNHKMLEHEPGSVLQDDAGNIGILCRNPNKILFLTGPDAYKLGTMENVRAKFRMATLAKETP